MKDSKNQEKKNRHLTIFSQKKRANKPYCSAKLCYVEPINKAKHPKKGGIQGNNWEDPLSKKTNDPPKRGTISWGPLFLVCLGIMHLT
jgi:hypothetical protein